MGHGARRVPRRDGRAPPRAARAARTSGAGVPAAARRTARARVAALRREGSRARGAEASLAAEGSPDARGDRLLARRVIRTLEGARASVGARLPVLAPAGTRRDRVG